MRLGARILLGYALVLGLSSWLLLSSALDTVKPAMRQSAEEALVDTANLLAAVVADDVKRGTVTEGVLAASFARYDALALDARIWDVDKRRPGHRIYITNARGTVLFDSSGRDVGADYSRWNDVYLTLRGLYGARSTREDPNDEQSTVMYVAAPVRDGDRIIGVLTVAKPNVAMQPFIDRSRRRLLLGGLAVLASAIVASVAVSWWTSRSVRQLADYAQAVSTGERRARPRPSDPELAALGAALEDMRARLDGKAYVERYVQTLTHELKSPLASILGAAELLHDDLPAHDRGRFLANIENEATRIRQLVDRLLDLAQVEQQASLGEQAPIALRPLVEGLTESAAPRAVAGGLTLQNELTAACVVRGDAFLLRQGLANLLDNALDFTPRGGTIGFSARSADAAWEIECRNSGARIPDYALPRLGERFFSLPRPATGRKSSGLGLRFVHEVAALHGGEFTIANEPQGVVARLRLPAG